MSLSRAYTLKDGSTKWIDYKDVHLWEDKIVHPPDPNQSILDHMDICFDRLLDHMDTCFTRSVDHNWQASVLGTEGLPQEQPKQIGFRKPDEQLEAENQGEKPLLHNQPLHNGSGNTKLFQTKIDRDLAEQFKVLCAELGTTQKDMVERWICNLLGQYSNSVQS